ncbi:hypothetical protein L1987_08789 [Smallanthus sonchifolius]|uniref:Uncharacterized protein n=1 Tax=Smallanthus sonchifolius TaxID=185202 RepID=A0ACB9JL61_9ASTR|nr:hypothetical protein L1987_08789 [Smallanthus sonchifolius]
MRRFTRIIKRNFLGSQDIVKKIMNNFDKLKAKCYSFQRQGYLALEYKTPKAAPTRPSTPPNMTPQHKSFITGEAYDWSYMNKEGTSVSFMPNETELMDEENKSYEVLSFVDSRSTSPVAAIFFKTILSIFKKLLQVSENAY